MNQKAVIKDKCIRNTQVTATDLYGMNNIKIKEIKTIFKKIGYYVRNTRDYYDVKIKRLIVNHYLVFNKSGEHIFTFTSDKFGRLGSVFIFDIFAAEWEERESMYKDYKS